MENKKHQLDWVKRQAKKLKKETGCTHTTALNAIAVQIGYNNYTECQRALRDDSEDSGKPRID